MLLFFNNVVIYFLINVYSDLFQTALKYLKNTEANIHNILIITGDFNTRNNIWDLSFPYHSFYSDLFTDIADSMDLCLSKATNQVLTSYSNNTNELNSVINLIFLRSNSLELNNHMIYLEWKYSSDHTSLTVNISIDEEYVPTKKYTIIKNNKEDKFIAELINNIKRLDTENLTSKVTLKQTVQRFADKSDVIWFKHSKLINITKHSKA